MRVENPWCGNYCLFNDSSLTVSVKLEKEPPEKLAVGITGESMVTQKRGQTRKDASPACPSAETSTADVVVAKDAAAKNNYEIVNFRPKIVCTIEGDWVEKTVGLVPCIPLQFGDIKEARILKEQKLSHAIVKEDLGLYHVTTRYTNCWKGLFCSCEVQILVWSKKELFFTDSIALRLSRFGSTLVDCPAVRWWLK